jgi:hypothetical protein
MKKRRMREPPEVELTVTAAGRKLQKKKGRPLSRPFSTDGEGSPTDPQRKKARRVADYSSSRVCTSNEVS